MRESSRTALPALNRYLPALDALRFAAATVVVAFHCLYFFGLQDAARGPMVLLRGGWVGVDVFFVISGLVVTLSALRLREHRPDRFRLRFLATRLVRIAPLYLVTAMIFLLLADAAPLHGNAALRQIASHLSFTYNLWPDTSASINPPSWSLANEMQLYLVLILLLPWLGAERPWRVASAALLLALGYRALVFLWLGESTPGRVELLQHYSYVTPGMSDSFGLGAALALWLARRDANDGPPSRAGRSWLVLALLAGVLCLALGAAAVPVVVDGRIWESPAWAICLRSVIALAAGLAVLAVTQLSRGMGQKEHAWMRHAGDLSYGIYLWHALVILLVARHVEGPVGMKIALVIITTLLLAELGWRWIEQPAMRWYRAKARD